MTTLPWMQNLDLWLLRKLNMEWTHPVLDRLLPTVTNFRAWTPVLAVLIIAALIFGGARLRLLCVAIGLGIALGDPILSNSLKHLTDRPRPYDVVVGIVTRTLPESHPQLLSVFQAPVVHPSVLKADAESRSFPSSHVVNVCCVATVCWLIYGSGAWWVSLIALLVAWSRIYCGAHWPSDVAFAIPIGALCGWLAVCLTDYLWRRFGGRFFLGAFAATPSIRRPR